MGIYSLITTISMDAGVFAPDQLDTVGTEDVLGARLAVHAECACTADKAGVSTHPWGESATQRDASPVTPLDAQVCNALIYDRAARLHLAGR
jgi:hypothetical protein